MIVALVLAVGLATWLTARRWRQAPPHDDEQGVRERVELQARMLATVRFVTRPGAEVLAPADRDRLGQRFCAANVRVRSEGRYVFGSYTLRKQLIYVCVRREDGGPKPEDQIALEAAHMRALGARR